MTNRSRSLSQFFRFLVFRLFGSSEHDRLVNTLISTQLEADEDTLLNAEVRQKIEYVLHQAKSELDQLNYDGSWRYLNMARRVLALNCHADKRRNMAVAFRIEAEKKLSGWRQDAVAKILTENSSAEELEYAMSIMDDHFANMALKSKLKLRQVTFLLFVLSLQVACLFVFPEYIFLPNLQSSEMLSGGFDFGMVLPVLLFGSIGSTFNGIISVSKADMRIPEQKANYRYNVIRVILGALTGLMVYLFICAGIVDIIRVEADNFERIIIFAFIAGFSEDYLVELIGRARAQG